eukprot:5411150-Amphidinium_carterae.1
MPWSTPTRTWLHSTGTRTRQLALQGAGEDEVQDFRRQWLLKRAASKNEVTQTRTRTTMQNRDGSLPNRSKMKSAVTQKF